MAHTYEYFNAYLDSNPGTPVVEMNTIIGRKGGKVLLTLFFRNCSLMIAILLEARTQDCVLSAINTIYNSISKARFLITLMITTSAQKPHIEKKHEVFAMYFKKEDHWISLHKIK